MGFLVLATVVAGALAAAAAADPIHAQKSAPITITCGSTVYHAVVNGNAKGDPRTT